MAAFEVHAEPEGPRTIPAGACWIIEGALWVKIVWQADGERRTASVSLRDYQACVQRGDIRLASAPGVDYSIRRSGFLLSGWPALRA